MKQNLFRPTKFNVHPSVSLHTNNRAGHYSCNTLHLRLGFSWLSLVFQATAGTLTEAMNKQTNKQTNERTNEQTNKLTN